MRKKSAVCICLFFLSFAAFSQEEPEERIRIGFAEFENKAYAVGNM